ncbi:TPA: hypothetical protein TZH76_000222 [Streptococcus suis]|nr:hypothetical protein [Streptococcus suis]
MCEITAGQNEARQQKVSKKSNRCCFDEGLLHESGLLKTLFPTDKSFCFLLVLDKEVQAILRYAKPT